MSYQVNLIAGGGGVGMRKKSIQPTARSSRQAAELTTRTRRIHTSSRETYCDGWV